MIENKAKFSGIELRFIYKEENLININDNIETIGVSIDTRSIEESNMFVPLKGENIDGNTLIKNAIEKGANISLVDRDYYNNNKLELRDLPLVIVENTLNAIGLLANFHRKRFDIPIIAIGGSNGKTTTKEMLSHILSSNNKILKTYKNYNNQLGVPLMLLCLDNSYDAAVLEIGTNEPGEIAKLAEMVEPTHGLITNIGKEHLEQLIDIRGVELEETFLFGQLRKFNKMSFINYDDPILKNYVHLLDTKFVFGQDEGLHVTFKITLDEDLHPKLNIATYRGENFKVTLNGVYGMVQAYNAMAAITIAYELGEEIDTIVSSISEYKPAEGSGYGRMLIEKLGDMTIINDCYNANPNSVSVALDTLKLYGGTKIAVLGDMLELGETKEQEHIAILEKASAIADRVFLYGNIYSNLEQKQNSSHYTDKQKIAEIISEQYSGSTVLIKGSRGMKLEDVVNQLKSRV